MKNWEPFESGPEFAIDKTPEKYFQTQSITLWYWTYEVAFS